MKNINDLMNIINQAVFFKFYFFNDFKSTTAFYRFPRVLSVKFCMLWNFSKSEVKFNFKTSGQSFKLFGINIYTCWDLLTPLPVIKSWRKFCGRWPVVWWQNYLPKVTVRTINLTFYVLTHSLKNVYLISRISPLFFYIHWTFGLNIPENLRRWF